MNDISTDARVKLTEVRPLTVSMKNDHGHGAMWFYKQQDVFSIYVTFRKVCHKRF